MWKKSFNFYLFFDWISEKFKNGKDAVALKCSLKNCFEKFPRILRKTPVPLNFLQNSCRLRHWFLTFLLFISREIGILELLLAVAGSSHQRCSVRKGVLRNFAKFTGKDLCQILFFNKVASLTPATLLKERLWHRCFPVSFAKFLRTPFLQNTSRRLLRSRYILHKLGNSTLFSKNVIFMLWKFVSLSVKFFHYQTKYMKIISEKND